MCLTSSLPHCSLQLAKDCIFPISTTGPLRRRTVHPYSRSPIISKSEQFWSYSRIVLCRLHSSDVSIQSRAKEEIPTKSLIPKMEGKQRVGKVAVVTGANKGIGLETARQLASQGITVVLAARNQQRGIEATDSLHQLGLTNVVFHQLDVLDPISVQSLASFIQHNFGSLDILVNNAAASGTIVDEERLKAMNIDTETWLSGKAVDMIKQVITTNFEVSELCLNTNYYGVKRVTEALMPLLQLSSSGARIVNVSSLRSELRRIRSEELRNELNDIETLTVEKLDGIVERFLKDFKENRLEEGGWSLMLPAYSISKASLNAYTRILAKRYPKMLINCVHPGYVDTDLNWHTGPMPVEEGARGPVKCALLPDGGPTGCYFDQTEVAPF